MNTITATKPELEIIDFHEMGEEVTIFLINSKLGIEQDFTVSMDDLQLYVHKNSNEYLTGTTDSQGYDGDHLETSWKCEFSDLDLQEVTIDYLKAKKLI